MNEPPQKDAVGPWAFLLAHHWPGELDRCWQVGRGKRPIYICARCAGLYPVMAAVLIWQILAPIAAGWYDWLWLFLPGIPALWDWGRSRLSNRRGSNRWRTISGAGLGMALGRALYLHLVRPFNLPVALLLAFLTIAVAGVELLRYKSATRRKGSVG